MYSQNITKEALKKEIKEEVIKSVLKYIKNYRQGGKKTFQPLDLLIQKERKVRSIVGGIETSMGRTLWEPLAKRLALLNGFDVVEKKLKAPKHAISDVRNLINTIINNREKGDLIYDAISTREEIRKICSIFIKNPIEPGFFVATTKGQGVDIWLKKNDINYLYDTKTVQPNIDKFKSMLSQLINWYGYFYMEYPEQQVECKIVFPYNPYGTANFWARSKGGGRPLDHEKEASVGNEFWDFISGYDGTLEIIYEVFSEIEAEGTLKKKFKNLFA